MTDADELTIEMRRVLSAVRDFAHPRDVDVEADATAGLVPLRRIANRTFDGDAQQAARVLAALDAAGLIRTDTMGWHRGWITEKGQQALLDLRDSLK